MDSVFEKFANNLLFERKHSIFDTVMILSSGCGQGVYRVLYLLWANRRVFDLVYRPYGGILTVRSKGKIGPKGTSLKVVLGYLPSHGGQEQLRQAPPMITNGTLGTSWPHLPSWPRPRPQKTSTVTVFYLLCRGPRLKNSGHGKVSFTGNF